MDRRRRPTIKNAWPITARWTITPARKRIARARKTIIRALRANDRRQVVVSFGAAVPLAGLAQLHRAFQIHRHELRDPALGHGDAVEAIHARHGDWVVGDDDEAGFSRARHLVEQVAEAFDVVIIERRVDLVGYVDRGWGGG